MVGMQETRQGIGDILRRLVAEYAPQWVILFGSYAYGNPRSDRDIDLLIIQGISDRFSEGE
jgi:predicted nucleotidyltransferase